MLAHVRRALLVLVPLIAWPATASSQPTATLTLKGPGATTYLHRIDFAGRLSPVSPDARIRLVRGTTFVASTPLRADGTFVFHVELANPGPFRVAWLGLHSNEVTVRIHPRLDAQLVGSRVTGAPLRLLASLTPPAAGAVRVQVIRSGQVGFDRRFAGRARVSLGTRDIGPLRIRLTTVPRPGYDPVARELTATLVPPTLSAGTTSPAVTELARQLAALHYAVPSLSSTFSYDLVESVWAFQKVQGLDRTGVVDPTFWSRLNAPRIPQARYTQPADHIEVDKTHQVLYVVRNGQITLISPVATAGIAGYYTPEGRFAIYRKVTGWDTSPLGVLWDPMYFVGGYAIHGGDPVPPYPASHGCVRVPDFVIYRLFTSEPYGETVYVYS
jgi:L,D-transpeptidase catalytic domain/Putative peptidoglycan binding domain